MKPEKITLNSGDKLSLINNLSTMLGAGIPILETVDSLLEDSKGSVKKLLEVVREDLIQGHHLHTSFSKFPLIFDKVTVNVIKASEEAGTLDVTLKDIQKQIKKEIEFKDKIKYAMAYPIVIFIIFTAVLLLILTVVVPKISTVFLRLKMQLPLPTRVMIFTSDLILHNTIFFILGVGAFAAFMVFLYKTKKQLLLGFFFSLPLIRGLIKEIDLTRFSRSLHLLLSSGITITTALDLACDVVAKKEIANAISKAKEMVYAGRDLSDGFRENKEVFSGIMIKILEAGEKTGTLEKSMQDISEHLDYKVSNTLRTLTALLEPIMLVIVGIMVGAMMMSIIAPIYNLMGQVSSR